MAYEKLDRTDVILPFAELGDEHYLYSTTPPQSRKILSLSTAPHSPTVWQGSVASLQEPRNAWRSSPWHPVVALRLLLLASVCKPIQANQLGGRRRQEKAKHQAEAGIDLVGPWALPRPATLYQSYHICGGLLLILRRPRGARLSHGCNAYTMRPTAGRAWSHKNMVVKEAASV